MLNIGEEYRKRMFEKGLYYDKDSNIYYNEFGVYLWSVFIYVKKPQNQYLEMIPKEFMENLGNLPSELQGKNTYMFMNDFLQLEEKKNMGHELLLVNQNEYSSVYAVYSKNYKNVFETQKTLQK